MSLIEKKQLESDEIIAQIVEYRKRGGQITKIPPGKIAQDSAVTGSLKKDFDRARFNGRRR